MDTTLNYYNQNADEFFDNTAYVDMQELYGLFVKYLPDNASILDCGCGSGRDSKYFLSLGYDVTAIDGSIELCKRACRLTGLDVKHMYFQDIAYENEFDGIWACSSLLHLKKSELSDVFNRLYTALKSHGVLYVSFKNGHFEGERNGRYFTDLTEDEFKKIIANIPGFSVIEKRITGDVREGREDEKWLNLVLKK